ncbi:MAG: type II secretion system protein GspE, partial [Proteobacteria bacterium]
LVELGVNPANVSSRKGFKPGTRECTTCQSTRYLGRTGIHELLIIDDEIRSLVLQRVDSNSIKNAASKRGFLTLRADGARKVMMGQTSVEEVLLATHEEFS